MIYNALSKFLTESMGFIYQMKFEKLKLIAIFSGLNFFFKVWEVILPFHFLE